MADKPRMKHFLRQHLQDPEYRQQLQWVDSEKQVFRVLWMHAGRATFDKELHWKLFHKYREYRGKETEGAERVKEGRNELWGSRGSTGMCSGLLGRKEKKLTVLRC